MNRDMTGAEMVVQALKDQGVDTVFGYPGGAVLPIYDAIFQQNDIRHILVRHEQGATHAAEGYARSTGRPGVVLVTSGPGATNAVTGMTDALMDSIPMVVLTGQVPTFMIGNDAFQEADTVGITRPCTKHNWLVKDPAKLAETIHQAFHVATHGRPGPVLVDIPKDVQFATARYTPPETARVYALPAAHQGRRRRRSRGGRGAGAGRAAGDLFRRRRRQLRARGEPAAARAGRRHRLSDHLDADGARRLSRDRARLDRHARDARHLRGQLGDARLRLHALCRRAVRRPDHRPHRRLLAGLLQGADRHRPLVDQQEHPRPGADRRRRRLGARRHAGALEGARVEDALRGDRQVVAADRALARAELPRLPQLGQDHQAAVRHPAAGGADPRRATATSAPRSASTRCGRRSTWASTSRTAG